MKGRRDFLRGVAVAAPAIALGGAASASEPRTVSLSVDGIGLHERLVAHLDQLQPKRPTREQIIAAYMISYRDNVPKNWSRKLDAIHLKMAHAHASGLADALVLVGLANPSDR